MYDDYSYYTTGSNNGVAGGLLAGLGLGVWLISMAISIIVIIATWKLYKKAGKPGWASIVPIYNIIVLLEIAELPMWYFVLLLLPFANIYAMFKIYIEIAHKFGKSTGFGVLLTLFNPICTLILAFGKSQYKENNVKEENNETNNTNFSYNNSASNQTFSSNQANEQFSGTLNNNLNNNQANNNEGINDFNAVNNLNNGVPLNEVTANETTLDNNTFKPSSVASSEPVVSQIPNIEPATPNTNVSSSEPVVSLIPNIEPATPNTNVSPSEPVVSPMPNIQPVDPNNINNINN